MEQPFHEALKEARLASRYPRACDFIAVSGLHHRTYTRYEGGVYLPELAYLNLIIQRCGLSEQTANKLRELHAVEAAKKLGVEMRQLPPGLKVSDLAEKIQREVEYELKRAGTRIMGNTRKVCIRRIEMLLKDALRIQ